MTPRKSKIFVGVIIAITSTVAAFFIVNTYIYNEKQSSNENIERYRATLEGAYICLNENSLNEECIEGLRTDVGETYSIDFMLMSQMRPPISINDRIMATGLVTPIELISASQWHDLGVEGIFSVTDSVEVKK